MDNSNQILSEQLLAKHKASSVAGCEPVEGGGQSSQSQDDAPPPAKRSKTGMTNRMQDWG